MVKSKTILLPKQRRLLVELGENIKLARLRRRYSAEMVSERAGISRTTLYDIERGTGTVNIGAYLAVLFVLNLENDLLEIAKDDVLGRKLQDAEIKYGKRSSVK